MITPVLYSKHLLMLTLVCLGLAACSSDPAPYNNGPSSLLVLGDASADHFSREGRGYRLGYGAFAGGLTDGGFDVTDEASAALDDFTLRDDMSRAALMDMARSMGARSDAVVLYSPSYSVSSNRIQVSLIAEALTASGGRQLASVSGGLDQRMPSGCRYPCQQDIAADLIAKLSRQLAAELVVKLGGPISYRNPKAPQSGDVRLGASSTYNVVLNGFNASEQALLQRHLDRLKGKQRSRVIYSDNRRTEIQYQTRAIAGSVVQQLDAFAESIGVNARVQFSGGDIKVDKVSPRIKRKSDRTLDDSANW